MKQRKWKLNPTTKAELNGLFPGYISFPIFFSFTYYIPVLKWKEYEKKNRTFRKFSFIALALSI